MTNTYKYKSPTEEWGYEKVKISKKEFEEIFGKKLRITMKVAVFTKVEENGRKWYCEVYVSSIGENNSITSIPNCYINGRFNRY